MNASARCHVMLLPAMSKAFFLQATLIPMLGTWK